MSPTKKMKARIHAWMRNLKPKLQAQDLSDFSRVRESGLSPRDEIMTKYYHLVPRIF